MLSLGRGGGCGGVFKFNLLRPPPPALPRCPPSRMPCRELRGGYRKDGVISLLYAQIPGCYHFVTGDIPDPSLHVTFAFIICNLSKLQPALPGDLLQRRHATPGAGGCASPCFWACQLIVFSDTQVLVIKVIFYAARGVQVAGDSS